MIRSTTEYGSGPGIVQPRNTRLRLRALLAGLASLTSLGGGVLTPAQATTYSFTSIGVPGEQGDIPNAASSNGITTGAANDYLLGFVDNGGTVSTFTVPGEAEIFPEGVNSSGEVAGGWDNATRTQQQGFLYGSGGATSFNVPGATQTFGSAINNAGQIAGSYYDSSTRTAGGFVSTNGNFTTFEPSNATSVYVTAMNNSGAVTGYDYPAVGGYSRAQGFLYSNGVLSSIDVPGASQTEPQAINASGEVVGWYQTGGQYYSCMDVAGTITTLNLPGEANGITDSGEIVGTYTDGNGVSHGFTDVGGVINTLDVPGATDTYIRGVSADGDIFGQQIGTGFNMGFLATPELQTSAPEPASLTVLLVGALGAASARRSRRRSLQRRTAG